MIIRPEEGRDRIGSIEVEAAAFGEPAEARIVEAIRDEPGSFALVAEVDGGIVGHVQMSTAWVGEDEVLALGPIGVLPSHQGRGIGTALVAAALDASERRGAPAVILLGSPAYYGARGFVPAVRFGLRNPFAGVMPDGSQIEEEDFQIAVLKPAQVDLLTGDTRWHAAFG
ncbi:MAG: N-acetyltransferase [Actinomycetota bacterium]